MTEFDLEAVDQGNIIDLKKTEHIKPDTGKAENHRIRFLSVCCLSIGHDVGLFFRNNSLAFDPFSEREERIRRILFFQLGDGPIDLPVFFVKEHFGERAHG